MPNQADTPSKNSDEGAEAENPLTECRMCGTEIDRTTWHLVATRVDDEGEFHLYSFCSVECRTRWKND